MKFIKEQKVLFIVSALVLSSFLLVSSHKPAQAFDIKTNAKKCVATYKVGKGKHKEKNYAGKKAIKNWSAQVSSSLGSKWSSWKHASAKSIPCTYSKQSKLWGCRAIAKPCAYKPRNKIGSYKRKN